jgi:RNA 2',3'-cyclic 3'-phosphodiesterase
MTGTVRAFIAIELPGDAIAGIRGVQAAVRTHGLDIRWVRPENIHLTLKFFGNIPVQDTGRVAGAMTTATPGIAPLLLAIGGLGVFPGIRSPRVLWAGLSGETVRLGELHGRLDAELARIGFKPERRAFKAHLTLGRPRGRIDPKRLVSAMADAGGYAPIPFTAFGIDLIQSRLTPTGPIYTRLERVLLG